MILKEINGDQLIELITSAALNLRANYQEVDELNVFPVPDGDTGTNMSRTIEGGVNAIKDLKGQDVGVIAKALSKGMLMSARGNSGVILSQIFRGICKGLVDKTTISVKELGEAYKLGVKQAYGAVETPVEGTILTVFREATEAACEAITDDTTVNQFFEIHLKKALVSLKNTPKLLPVLKEAGVIDSGGCGYTYIVKGIVKYLDGEKIELEIENANKEEAPAVDFSAFSKDDTLKFGYCTEFILRLQTSKVDVEAFDVNTIIDILKNDQIQGDSIVALKDEDVIKVHVHTMNPGHVLNEMRAFGEFLTIKIENMALQHNESLSDEEKETQIAEHKKYAVVAVAQGSGIEEQFKELGVDIVVSGNQTMNPSTEDFIKAFKRLNADNIFVFPNNKNIIMAAQQAAKLYKGAKIIVVKSTSIPQCYSALTMLDFSSNDLTIILGNFNAAIKNVISGEITTATRSTTLNKVIIHKGEHIGILNGKMAVSSPNKSTIVANLLGKIKDIKDKEILVIFFGSDVTEKEKESNLKAIERKYPHLEVGAIDGGQAVYKYLISVE